ncbi:MAG: hypothetical protein E2P06_16030 [Acidobacteria bacterium]|nr:MAG: hypothetical protein E2P06_16030 [Acidobacteriota bacterium]
MLSECTAHQARDTDQCTGAEYLRRLREFGEGEESEGQAYVGRGLEHRGEAEWAIDEVRDARARRTAGD